MITYQISENNDHKKIFTWIYFYLIIIVISFVICRLEWIIFYLAVVSLIALDLLFKKELLYSIERTIIIYCKQLKNVEQFHSHNMWVECNIFFKKKKISNQYNFYLYISWNNPEMWHLWNIKYIKLFWFELFFFHLIKITFW